MSNATTVTVFICREKAFECGPGDMVMSPSYSHELEAVKNALESAFCLVSETLRNGGLVALDDLTWQTAELPDDLVCGFTVSDDGKVIEFPLPIGD